MTIYSLTLSLFFPAFLVLFRSFWSFGFLLLFVYFLYVLWFPFILSGVSCMFLCFLFVLDGVSCILILELWDVVQVEVSVEVEYVPEKADVEESFLEDFKSVLEKFSFQDAASAEVWWKMRFYCNDL